MSLLVREGLVSTVIPVSNQAVLSIKSVESVLAQTYRPIEIIIVNAGASHETAQRLSELAVKYSEVRIFSQPNQALCAARELGRLNAKGEFIQYCENGDVLLPAKFAAQIKALKLAANSDVAYGNTQELANESTVFESMFPFFLHKRGWQTANPLYRRSIVDLNGPWLDTAFYSGWEYDCRIAKLGARTAFVDQVVSAPEKIDRAESQGNKLQLQDLSLVRAKIFRHAQSYMQLEQRPTEIKEQDWQIFSESAFELACECALNGLKAEARAMTNISIESIGKKTPRHRIFLMMVKWAGWKKAAQAIMASQKN